MPNTTGFTVLGFDFGMKRIGVAVGQTITQTANPIITLHAIDGIPNWSEIQNLIAEWGATHLVVGLPYQLDGSKQETTLSAQKFSRRLQNKFGLPVDLIDERLTTKSARQALHDQHNLNERSQIDSYAAKLILESWLRNQK